MFCRLVGRQFARACSGRNKRHLETCKAPRRVCSGCSATPCAPGRGQRQRRRRDRIAAGAHRLHRLMQAQAELEGFEGVDDPDLLITAAEKSDPGSGIVAKC